MDENKIASAIKTRETEIIGKFYSQLSSRNVIFRPIGFSEIRLFEKAEGFFVGDFDFFGAGKCKIFFFGEKEIFEIFVFKISS